MAVSHGHITIYFERNEEVEVISQMAVPLKRLIQIGGVGQQWEQQYFYKKDKKVRIMKTI